MLHRNALLTARPYRHRWTNGFCRHSSTEASNEPVKKYLSYNDIPSANDDSQTFTKYFRKITQLATGSWKRFHEHIDERHRQLGPIFREPVGPIEAVFINSPNLLRDVFAYEGKYPKHPLPEAWTFYNQLHNCKRGLFFMDDEEWLCTRKQLAPLMLRNDDRFLWAIERASNELVADWKRHANRSDFTEMPNMLGTLYHWSIMVLIRIMFGHISEKIIADTAPLIAEFAATVQNVFEDTVPFMSVSPQWARKFNLKIWNKFETSVHRTLSIASRIIDYGIAQCQCDGLLNDMQQLGMSDEMIKRIFIDLIVAAGDTTAFSTQWALYLLSRDTQMQSQVRQELSASPINQHETPLVRGSVREALRMFPVATFVGRILGKDAILNGYHVDKFTLVLISMYSAGRDETSFPEANRFLPWRWNRDPSTGALKYVAHAQSSIPYALGARNCIGQRIANAQMHVLLSTILRTFEVELCNAKQVDLVMRLIIMPKETLRFGVKIINWIH